jgi:hypothetical protein
MADSKRVIYLVCLADNLDAPQSIPQTGMVQSIAYGV